MTELPISYSLYQYDDETTLLGEFESIDALHAELETTAAKLQQAEESDGWLCASKYADRIEYYPIPTLWC